MFKIVAFDSEVVISNKDIKLKDIGAMPEMQTPLTSSKLLSCIISDLLIFSKKKLVQGWHPTKTCRFELLVNLAIIINSIYSSE